ncbi:hypothetical protein ABZ820_33570 [Streptomyces diacarni]|uniref:hypothetical protein n=1 Tax=Streptomyces diacarni TaxID=2800381 RepID=UPI00340A4E7B
MANRLVSVDSSYLFPTPLEARLAAKMTASVTDDAVAAQINGAQTGPAIDHRVGIQVAPVVDQLVAEAIADDQTIVDAAAAAVDANPKIASLETAQWRRGILPNGTNYQTGLAQSGWWWITTFANAQTMVPPLPEPGAGVLTRKEVGGSLTLTWEPIQSGSPGGIWKMERLGSTFTGWNMVTGKPRKIPLNDNLNNYRSEFHQGPWWIYVTSEAQTVVNRPPFTGGFYLDVKFFNNIAWQIAYPAGDASQKQPMTRKYRYFPSEGWNDWEPLGGSAAPSSTTTQQQRHLMLKQRNRLGHGGVIGVGDKVAVGLSFDHGFANYRDILLPHLTRLGLPHAAAVNTATLNTGESAGVSYPQLQDWALNKGLVLANHGRSHSDATTESGMEDMILGSLELLKTNCPKTIVDTFIAPGTSGTGFDGFNNGMDDYTKWWTHPAGRIMIDNHASVTAGMYGMALPLDGEPIQSMDRVGFDYDSQATEIQNRITALQGTGMGIQIFNHPSLIDVSGYITTTRIVAFLEWLAAERDAGRVEVLSSAAFAWARSGTVKRHDLAKGAVWSAGSTTIALDPLFNWVRGYHRQLAVKCSIAANVALTVTDNTGLLNTTVTQTVGAGSVARLNFGIPVDSTSITLNASTTAGVLSEMTAYAV